jgi:hypothetical protein
VTSAAGGPATAALEAGAARGAPGARWPTQARGSAAHAPTLRIASQTAATLLIIAFYLGSKKPQNMTFSGRFVLLITLSLVLSDLQLEHGQISQLTVACRYDRLLSCLS